MPLCVLEREFKIYPGLFSLVRVQSTGEEAAGKLALIFKIFSRDSFNNLINLPVDASQM